MAFCFVVCECLRYFAHRTGFFGYDKLHFFLRTSAFLINSCTNNEVFFLFSKNVFIFPALFCVCE